jgi:hypothetical protein
VLKKFTISNSSIWRIDSVQRLGLIWKGPNLPLFAGYPTCAISMWKRNLWYLKHDCFSSSAFPKPLSNLSPHGESRFFGTKSLYQLEIMSNWFYKVPPPNTATKANSAISHTGSANRRNLILLLPGKDESCDRVLDNFLAIGNIITEYSRTNLATRIADAWLSPPPSHPRALRVDMDPFAQRTLLWIAV